MDARVPDHEIPRPMSESSREVQGGSPASGVEFRISRRVLPNISEGHQPGWPEAGGETKPRAEEASYYRPQRRRWVQPGMSLLGGGWPRGVAPRLIDDLSSAGPAQVTTHGRAALYARRGELISNSGKNGSWAPRDGERLEFGSRVWEPLDRQGARRKQKKCWWRILMRSYPMRRGPGRFGPDRGEQTIPSADPISIDTSIGVKYQLSRSPVVGEGERTTTRRAARAPASLCR